MKYPVQWPGHPHHIPRIRIASTGSSASPHVAAHIAAKQVLLRPLSPSLVQARKAGRTPLLHSSNHTRSITSSTRQRAFDRTKYNLQIFGWSSSLADQAVQLPRTRQSSLTSLGLFMAGEDFEAHKDTDRTATIVSFDGAGHSTARKKRSARSRARQENEVRPDITKAPLRVGTDRHLRTVKHNTSTRPGIRTQHQVRRGSQEIGRGRSYDKRITPRKIKKSSTVSSVCSRSSRRDRVLGSKSPEKQTSVPAARRKEGPMASKRSPRGERISDTRLPNELSISLTRSPSEKVALERFTKDLERHLRETQGLQADSSTVRSPKVSAANTVDELMPYKSQFNAAGLAVTSNEQKRTDGKHRSIIKSTKIEIFPARMDALQISPSTEVTSQRPLHRSDSTGAIEMSFTSPHTPYQGSEQASQFSSSDHTVIGFTPPHQIRILNASSTAQKTTRKSLPWLKPHRSSKACEYHTSNSQETEKDGGSTTYYKSGDAVQPSNFANASSDVGEIQAKDINASIAGTLKSPSYHSQGTRLDAYTTEFKRVSSFANRSKYSDKYNRFSRSPESACVPHAKQSTHMTSISAFPRDVTPHRESNIPSEKTLHGKSNDILHTYDSETYPTTHKARVYVESQTESDLDEHDIARSHIIHAENYLQQPPDSEKRDSPIQDCHHEESARKPIVCQQCFPSKRSSSAVSPLQVDSRKISRRKLRQAVKPNGRTVLTKAATTKLRSSKSMHLGKSLSGISLGNMSDPSSTRKMSPSKSSSVAVFRGLQVATAAACDEDIDRWIMEITGVSVQNFLASLSRFSGLGVISLADVARRATKQRREEVEKWEMTRLAKNESFMGSEQSSSEMQ